MKHRVAVLIASMALVLASAPTLAADPTADPAWSSVTLPDGTVLPPLPSAMLTPGIGAQMLAEGLPLPAGALTGDALGSTDAEAVGAIVGSFEAASAHLGPAGALPNGLRKEVLGFLPYWMLDPGLVDQLRYDLVSTIAYFSVGAQADGTLATGTASSPSTGWKGWTSSAMSNVLVRAHSMGVRVVLTVTMHAWGGDYTAMSALLNDPVRRARLVGQIRTAVGNRLADGVNIDFEPVPTSLRAPFTAFVRELKGGLVAGGVGSYLTVDTMAGAASWATGYDVAGLSAAGAADALMVMAYDFSWSGSARAGGVAPMRSTYIYDATDALNAYTAAVNPAKLIWGVPYYGRTWPTLDSTLNSLTCRATSPPVCPESTVTSPGASKSYYYTGAKSLADQYGPRWDATGEVPWFTWYNTTTHTWNQGYYDDARSLAAKYAQVNQRHLAGIGIWTLLMDAGTNALADVLARSFMLQINRITGADRYAVAANVSASFSPGVPVAYVAVGTKFPDALTAGPAAAHEGGPVLLTQTNSLPASVSAELSRLAPQRIVVAGGPVSVSNAVLAQLDAYTTGSVTRIGGADRYAVAAGISAATFSPGVEVAYLAVGTKFPDALSAGPAAAHFGGPVLLTETNTLPPVIAAELSRLNPGRIVVAGGPASVSDGVLAQLHAYTSGSVTRIGGADRYAVSAGISASFASPGTVFLATGANFPDALSGVPAAAALDRPMLLTMTGSVPASVAAEVQRLAPARIYVLGGPASVSDAVFGQLEAMLE